MAIRRPTLLLGKQLRVKVGTEADEATRALTSAWVKAWDVLSADMDAAVLEVMNLAAQLGRWPAAYELNRVDRLYRVMTAAQKTLAELGKRAGVTITDAAGRAIQTTADSEPGLIASQLPAAEQAAALKLYASRILPSALDIIVARTGTQIHSATWDLSSDAVEAMHRELVRGVAVGNNPREAGARMLAGLQDGFNGGLSRAVNIARTEILDAFRVTSQYAHTANADVLDGWIWLCFLSSRSCPACIAKNGSAHPVTEPGPLGHQQCVVGGATVSGPRAVASTTRWYRGQVVDIETDGGNLLTVTPNHPVLTTDGWVAAGELREGSHVISSRGLKRGPSATDYPNDHQIPALIEDVAQSLGSTLPMPAVSVPTAPEDFHGDGSGSEIHTVRTNGLLRNGGDASFSEQRHECFLLARHGNPEPSFARLSGLGALGFALGRERDSTGGRLRSAHDLAVLTRRPGSRDKLVGLGHWPDREPSSADALFDESARDAVSMGQAVDGLAADVSAQHFLDGNIGLGHDSGPRLRTPQRIVLGPAAPEAALDEDTTQPGLAYAVPTRDGLTAFAGDVFADRVLHIRRRSFSGHVYNLQTATGWFVANGIVTHNCRCARMPKVKSWKDLGINAPEPVSTIPDARKWFAEQPEATQRQMLGPGRLGLLNSGAISWDQIPVRRENPGWRPSYTPRSLADLQKIAKRNAA